MMAGSPALARTILFGGNRFTFGANSPVMRFHPERVTDLSGDGFGGVPALFKTFADEAGLDRTVSLETSPGKDLSWRLAISMNGCLLPTGSKERLNVDLWVDTAVRMPGGKRPQKSTLTS